MKGPLTDRSLRRADLLVHLGLGASVLATVILAVATMVDFGSNVDAIATRLALPPSDAIPRYLAGEPSAATNTAIQQGPTSQAAMLAPTNVQPRAAHPSPNRSAS
jgi:hypothetical protein